MLSAPDRAERAAALEAAALRRKEEVPLLIGCSSGAVSQDKKPTKKAKAAVHYFAAHDNDDDEDEEDEEVEEDDEDEDEPESDHEMDRIREIERDIASKTFSVEYAKSGSSTCSTCGVGIGARASAPVATSNLTGYGECRWAVAVNNAVGLIASAMLHIAYQPSMLVLMCWRR